MIIVTNGHVQCSGSETISSMPPATLCLVILSVTKIYLFIYFVCHLGCGEVFKKLAHRVFNKMSFITVKMTSDAGGEIKCIWLKQQHYAGLHLCIDAVFFLQQWRY